MKLKTLTICSLLLTSVTMNASCEDRANNTTTKDSTEVAEDNNSENADEFVKKWKAGTIVSEAQVKAVGIDNCFKAEEISDAVFARMKGKSYKEGCPIPLSDLRYLKVLHRNKDGKIQLGEMVCNRIIANKLLRIFRKLYDNGYKIERMVLIDDYDAVDEKSMTANNSSCFCYRNVSGTTTISKHGRGLAVDINTLYNPYVKVRDGKTHVEPEAGRPYINNRDKRTDIPFKIDRNDLAYKVFTAEGFSWGGNWNSVKDYQHFEYDPK